MKKFTALFCAALFAATASVSAYATTITPESIIPSGNTVLTYSVKTDYIVVIPDEATLNEELQIKATKANTEPGTAVNVRISRGLTSGSATLYRKGNEDYSITAPVKIKDKDD
ncbi:MAG: hypothetical protein ACI4GV_05490 [Acutalibacteraceae bacterium]